MTVGMLDSACITSVIDCLHCEKLELASPWAYRTAFEATAELIINPHLGLAPSPEGAQPSVGEFGIIQQHLVVPKLLTTAGNTKEAEKKAKDWFRDNSRRFRQSFQKLNNTDDFKTWLNHEIDFIWKNHAESQGGLFNKQLIPELAVLLRKDPKELEELRQLSGKRQEVQRLAKTRQNDLILLSEAYTGSFFLRGVYHDYAARLNEYAIMPHGLRRIRGFLPEEKTTTLLYFDHSQTTAFLANLIVQSARKEKLAKDRAKAYSEYIDMARKRSGSLDLHPKPTVEDTLEAAAQAAKVIGLRAKPRWVYSVLDAGIALIGAGITSFYLEPFQSFIAGSATGIISSKVNIGRGLGKITFDTERRFKAMLEAPPGRLRANWD